MVYQLSPTPAIAADVILELLLEYTAYVRQEEHAQAAQSGATHTVHLPTACLPASSRSTSNNGS